MARHHGFTCPACGSHFFGTRKHYAVMGDAYPTGTAVGMCNARQHQPSTCGFEWNRDDPQAEAQCMYEQTPEEWAADRRAFLDSLPSIGDGRHVHPPAPGVVESAA